MPDVGPFAPFEAVAAKVWEESKKSNNPSCFQSFLGCGCYVAMLVVIALAIIGILTVAGKSL
jgi:hypothetical protein